MASDCPTDQDLEAFSRGSLDPDARERIVTHVAGCSDCGHRFLPMALRASSLHTTNFDSPRARVRKISAEQPAVGAHSTRTTDPELELPPPVSGTEDTVISDEKSGASRPPPLKKGSSLDRYVVLDRLGSGGMGEVYASWDPVLDRKVAVKLLRSDFHDSPIADELRLRLLREAQALARLSHQHVVSVHDVGLINNQVYIAMEFAEGITLTAWLKAKPRTWQEILEVFLAAGEGLAAAHDVGITHRDFKPDNVVVNADGSRARVMDFGLAHARADERPVPAAVHESSGAMKRAITQPGMMLGTPAYMSPEALFGKPTDFRSDEFSFCVALYEALYGVRPFEGETPPTLAAEIQLNRVRPPVRDVRVPRRIRSLLLKGLRCNPDERFQTLRALLIQLGRRRSAVRRQVLFSALLGLVAIAVGVAVAVTRKEQQRCAQVERRLAGVWDNPVRGEARKAFLAIQQPWAATSWTDAERRLDAYSSRWVELRRATCEASASEADEALGQNIVCLSRRLADLEAVTQLFLHADAEVVERAVATASSLPSLEACLAPASRVVRSHARDDLRSELAAVKARIDSGKYREAAELAGAAEDRATQADDRGSLGEAELYTAIVLARTGDPHAADVVVEDAILHAESAQDDELVARAWVERVGFAAVGGASSDDGERSVRHARAALARIGGPPLLEASFANNLGVLAWSHKSFAEAIAAHQRALALRVAIFGADHPLVARSHSNLGTVYKAQGRLDEAIAEYRTAQAIEERVLDVSHPAVAETLNNLGNALQEKRDFEGARIAFERALEIKEKAYGPQSLSAAITLGNLGVLLNDQGQFARAEVALTRALEMKTRVAGADSLTVALTLTNLAQVQRAQRKWNEALVKDQQALAIRDKRLGSKNRDLAFNLTGIGGAMLGLGQPALAIEPLEKALALRSAPSPERGETSLLLARAVVAKNPQRANELVLQAVSDLPVTHPMRAEAEALLARLTPARGAAPPAPGRRGSEL